MLRWTHRSGELTLGGARPLIMGIVNVTPDSFSDGGRWASRDAAADHALRLLDAGADIVDIGGESTRPGAPPVPRDEELRRVLPVVDALARKAPHALLSVDTTKAEVAQACLEAGAQIINDVSAGRRDPAMLPLAARTGAGLVLMHSPDTPERMVDFEGTHSDIVATVNDRLRHAIEAARAAGCAHEQIVVDPGIGFGTSVDEAWRLLRALPELGRAVQRPVLVGVSRKRMLRAWVGPDEQRLDAATHLAGVLAANAGAAILRVHDVAGAVDAAGIAAAWRGAVSDGDVFASRSRRD